MKANLFLAGLVCIGFSASAQPTLTYSNNAPHVGDYYTRHLINPYQGAPGPSGANQTWSFSNVGTGAVTTDSNISCAASPDCPDYPGANVVDQDNTGINTYYIVDSSGIQLKGFYFSNTPPTSTQKIIYSTPEQFMYYPLHYNDTHTTNWAAVLPSTSMTFYRSGSTVFTADAYGTLTTPFNTYQNVIRVYRHQDYTDSTNGTTPYHYAIDIYTWYQPGNPNYLLSIDKATANGQVISQTLFYTESNPTNGIKDLSTDKTASVYPIPTNGPLTISLKNHTNAIQNIRIVNLLGQLVKQYPANQLLESAIGSYRLNLDELPTGLYWLQIQTNTALLNKKIQIVK